MYSCTVSHWPAPRRSCVIRELSNSSVAAYWSSVAPGSDILLLTGPDDKKGLSPSFTESDLNPRELRQESAAQPCDNRGTSTFITLYFRPNLAILPALNEVDEKLFIDCQMPGIHESWRESSGSYYSSASRRLPSQFPAAFCNATKFACNQ